jgi:probable F420-dependent oxidoreductase
MSGFLKIDAALLEQDLERVGDAALRLEQAGYDGAFSFEGPHDPFFPLAFAARATQRIELYTGIAIAFARSPMLLANIGWDLQTLSRGRFILGLGSQIRPHIEKRFSMPWSKPAARMGELVRAVREIWRCWQEGGKLDFRGEFYTHTLMTPFFNPGPNPFGPPRIFVAGVGPRMTEVAGEVGDGFLVHPFQTEASFRDLTLPALERGLARSGRSRSDLEIAYQVLVVSGETDEEYERALGAVRSQIAFYGSTPAYRPVLESVDRGPLQTELNQMSKRGRWKEMAERIDDDLLEAVAVVAPPGQLAARVRERFGKSGDRISLIAPWAPDPERWADVVRQVREG